MVKSDGGSARTIPASNFDAPTPPASAVTFI
jgi:hypothetical protein